MLVLNLIVLFTMTGDVGHPRRRGSDNLEGKAVLSDYLAISLVDS